MEIEKLNDELEHHGTKGMRWGIRRYQTKDGKLTPAGRKRYNHDLVKLKEKNAKLDAKIKTKSAEERAKARIKKLKDEAKAKKLALKGKNKVEDDVEETKVKKPDDGDPEAKASYEAAKQKAIRSGTAKEVLKFQGDLTNDELNQAITRLDYEAKLSSKSSSEMSPGMKKVDSVMNKVATVTDWADKGSKAYNMAAKIHNAFSDGNPWPIIGEKKQNQGGDNNSGQQKNQQKQQNQQSQKQKQNTSNQNKNGGQKSGNDNGGNNSKSSETVVDTPFFKIKKKK